MRLAMGQLDTPWWFDVLRFSLSFLVNVSLSHANYGINMQGSTQYGLKVTTSI